MEEADFEKPEQEAPEADPFTPFNDLPEERHYIVTIRALIIGCICGALVNASNVYLGLKTGCTYSEDILSAVGLKQESVLQLLHPFHRLYSPRRKQRRHLSDTYNT